MTNASRVLQAIFWGVILLLISPNKAAAISYAVLILILLVAVLMTLGVTRVIISAIKWIFRSS